MQRRSLSSFFSTVTRARIFVTLAVSLVAHSLETRAQEEPFSATTGTINDSGEIVHQLTSSWQSVTTSVRVLVPSDLKNDERLPVVFVLPVEAGEGTRWGDGLGEIRRLKLQERYRVICVAPSFSLLPWYADHPTDLTIRQESHLLKAVVPFVDATFPTTGKSDDRLLIGFSKSGWGAFSLLLRNPDVFGKAAGWDAPLLMNKPGLYGSGPIFGTEEQFKNYQITELLRQRAAEFSAEPRLIHLGYGNFREHHTGLEQLMNELNVSTVYQHCPQRKHAWDSGWLPEAMRLLCESK